MPNLIGTEARRSHKWSKNQIYTILGVFHFFKKICWQNRLIWQKTDFENLKNRQTAKMAVFRRFCNGFSIFSPFLPTKPANYENYELWKSEKPPNRQNGSFSVAVFERFLMVFNSFSIFSQFLPTKPSVFEWFLTVFKGFFNIFTIFTHQIG